jgi:hypothetical protein
MNTSTIALLLQTVVALLTAAHNNPALASTAQQQLVTLGSRTVQIATQALAPIPFVVTPNTDTFPTIGDLMNAPALTATGSYVPLAPGLPVKLDQSSVSFGDLNADGMDDAAGIVTQTATGGATSSALAVFLNQGGVMFNIADEPLGSAVTVYSHHVVNGALVLDMQVAGESRGTFTYSLLGNQIVKD